MTILRSLFQRGTLNSPTVPLSASNIATFLGVGTPTKAGVDVSSTSAMQNMAVWRAVNLIAGTIAGLPLKLYRNQSDGIRVEVVDNQLFSGEAYPDLTWFEYVETTVVHLLLWGNAYTLKVKNEAGDKILRVRPLPPWDVQVGRDNPTLLNPSGKTFKLAGQDDTLSPQEVMHIPGLGYDGLKGLSPIGHARQAIGVAVAAEEVAAKMFDSGLLNAGVIQAETELTAEEAEAVKRSWREKVSGVVRSYEIAVLANGLKYQPATIPPREAQWLEARQFGVQEIARLYGIDPDHLMENSATGNTNVEQRAINLVKFGLNPWLRRLEKRMSVHLAPRATFVEFTVDALLRADAATRAQVYSAALNPQTGWMERNEVRALENLPPIDDDEDLATEEDEEPPAPEPDEEDDDEQDEEAEANAA